ncbi:MAG: hypothetical protein U0Q10_05855 [Dermatophilaceae bacterium]
MGRALDDLSISMLRGAAAAALVACVVGLIDLLTLDAQYALAPNAAALFVPSPSPPVG